MTQYPAVLLEASAAPNSDDGTLWNMYVCVYACVCLYGACASELFIYSRWFSLILKSDETVVTVKVLPALIYNTFFSSSYSCTLKLFFSLRHKPTHLPFMITLSTPYNRWEGCINTFTYCNCQIMLLSSYVRGEDHSELVRYKSVTWVSKL